MRAIRCLYHGVAPNFPATDQSPEAVRYGPLTASVGTVYVDAIGGQPTSDEIEAVINPPRAADMTTADKLATIGLGVADLKTALGLA